MTDPLWSTPRAAGAAQVAAAKRRAKRADGAPTGHDTPAERAEWRGDEPPTMRRRPDADAPLAPAPGAAGPSAPRGADAPTAPLPSTPAAASAVPAAVAEATERPASAGGDAPATARPTRPAASGGDRPPRAPISKPGPFPVIALSLELFLAIVALLAFQMRAGADPAIGKGEPVQVAAATSAPRKVLVRRVIVTRIVEHRRDDAPTAPAAAAPPRTGNSAPAPAASAPAPVAPAPAPAAPPVTTRSS